MATLEELYNALKADGAPLPETYDKFEKYMTTGPRGGYDHSKKVYDALKADGAPLPDTYEKFSKSLSLFSGHVKNPSPDTSRLPIDMDKTEESTGAATIENYTEMLGSHLGAIGSAIRFGVASGIRRFGGGRLLDSVSNLTSRISATKWAQGISNLERRAQWAGPIGEMLEEEAGIVLNAATVGDNSMSDLIDPETQIDIALGVGLFGGFVSGVKSIGYPVARYGARRRMNRAEARAGEIFGDGWRDVRTRMDTAPDADLSAVVAGIATDPDITDSHRSDVIDYARALTNLRGFNQANSSARSDGETPREKVEAEEAFDRGYDLAGAQERNEARLRMERRREALVGSLGEDRVAEFDRDPPGVVKLRRCMLSVSELSIRWSGDSLIYHADSSMSCTELQILQCKVTKSFPIANATDC